MSLSQGVFPDSLKLAKVIPVYKSSDPNLIANYRPISLLPAFSKIFEKVMYKKLMVFLERFDLLYRHQYGFRKKHNTVHPIVHLLSSVAEANSQIPSNIVLSIFCDLSKAFDVINHDILMDKLYRYGIRGVAHKWLKCYLSNRMQYVEYDKYISSTKRITTGVPQGSILGPLLFLIFVNDIQYSSTGTILSFADDTTLIFHNNDLSRLYNEANRGLSDIQNWFCANGLKLNIDKTKYIIIHPQNKRLHLADHELLIDGVKLTRVGNDCPQKHAKFLGVLLDENLKWNEHISHVNNKIASALYIMNQVKNFLPLSSLKIIYYALIHSHLNYGLISWGSASKSLLKRTHILHKKAMRIVSGAGYNSHSLPLHKRHNVLNLSDLFNLHVCLFMHDHSTQKLPRSFTNMFRLNSDVQRTYRTRSNNLYYVGFARTSFVKCLPPYLYPNIWNTFSKMTDASVSKQMFKRALTSAMLAKYPERVMCQNRFCRDCY